MSNDAVTKFLAEAGRKGGKSKSKAKRAASRETIKIARAARLKRIKAK